MGFRYLVLGAGRQGTAAAYDLASFGDSSKIVIADLDLAQAKGSAERVNALVAGASVVPETLDVRDFDDCKARLQRADVALSAVPYSFNLQLTRAAIAAHCGICDLGGNTEVVREQLELNQAALDAKISVVPDCGLGPGFISNLAVFAAEMLDEATEVRIWDGGLPANPRPPFNYACFFNFAGLVNEYLGDALYIRDGKVTKVPALSEKEYELIEIAGVGKLEAFTTSGALSTLADSYVGQLKTLENKTLRYPGHFHLLQRLSNLGLFSGGKVEFEGNVVPARQALEHVFARAFAPEQGDTDLVVVHVEATGAKDGKPATAVVDLIDRHDAKTGFSAMERCTGFHLAVVAEMIARGGCQPGVQPLEKAVASDRVVEEMARRGIKARVSLS